MAVRFFLKAISHPKTPSARRRRWGGVSGGYAASATAPPAKIIVVKPAKIIVAVYPYLGVCFTDDQHGYAVGPFGMLVATSDAGRSWHPALDKIDNPQFLHLNAIREIGGALYIAAEKGIVFRLDSDTGRFLAMRTGDKESLFGVTGSRDALIAYGLRGNAYRSRDQGRTWGPLPTHLVGAVTGGAYVRAKRAVVLATIAGEVASVDADGQEVKMLALPRPVALTSVGARSGELIFTSLSGVVTASGN